MFSKYRYSIIFLVLIVFFSLFIYITRPAPDDLASYSTSLAGLTRAQRKNICLAARSLNGRYINPSEDFSFNAVVGPRTLERGFVPSKVIFEGDIIESVGGGICLLSSTLYNAVIRSGLKVIKRVPHTKTIKSVPIGLDATVWYGRHDLKFKNTTSDKLKISAICTYNRLNIVIKGKTNNDMPEIIVEKHKLSSEELQVSVYRKLDNIVERLSDDIYKIK